MSNIVDISVEENLPEPVWLSKIEPFVQKILCALEKSNWELSVFFCGDAYIRSLNKQYRNIDSATDILSFEAGDPDFPAACDTQTDMPYYAGDLVISLETLPVNAQYFGIAQTQELQRLLVHGILHLSRMFSCRTSISLCGVTPASMCSSP